MLRRKREDTKHYNYNGRRIIEMCLESDLGIANTKFRHKMIHRYKRMGVGREEKFIIDYILVDTKK